MVERYDCITESGQYGGGYGAMENGAFGDYVRFEDYAKLQALLARCVEPVLDSMDDLNEGKYKGYALIVADRAKLLADIKAAIGDANDHA